MYYSTFSFNESSNGLIRCANNTAKINTNDCIIYNNSHTLNGKLISYNGAGATFSNTLIDVPDCVSIANGQVICGPGMRYLEDPLFLDPANGDFRLHPCSPARNAGSNAIVDSLGILTDITGAARIQGGTVDMGAYESPAFQATSATVATVPCGLTGAGTVALTLEHGCPPFFLDWSAGSSIADSSLALLNLPVGSHSITVTDGRMESDTISITISPSPVIMGSANATDIACVSGTGGTANIEAVGGTGTFSFLWSNGDTTATATNLQAGGYQVTATDGNGCTLVDSVTIGITGNLSLGINVSPITCHGDSDGTATVQPLGGTMPFAWLWQSGEATPTLDGLSGGSYSATVTDALGCTGDIDFTITPPAPIGVSTTVMQPLCFGQMGTATATATGGTGSLHFAWDNGATTASTMLAEGTHTVTATDSKGCTATGSANITAPPVLEFTLSLEPPLLCHGASDGTFTVVPTGGTPPYSWAGQTEDISAGSYAFTVTDANGCAKVQVVQVFDAPPISANAAITHASSPTATDGVITISGITGGTGGGYQFLWSNGSTAQGLSGLPTGDYSLTVTDSQGCTASFDYFVDFGTAAGEAPANPFGAAIVPNPSGNAGARLVLGAALPGTRLRVFDAQGRLVYEGQVASTEHPLPKGLAAGTYRVVLEGGGGRAVLGWVVGE